VFDDIAVITRPGAASRRAETSSVEAAVAALGLVVERINAPGTLEGGDVLKVGSTVYVGRTARTNDEGIGQLRQIAQRIGRTVVEVPLTKTLHLKSAVTALPDGTVIGWREALDDISMFPRFISVPEESGAHVVLLGGNRVLMADDAPRTGQVVRSLGYEPVTVDISEFVKLEGCVTCLSVRLRRP
jgi:dimethylargininase